MHGVNMRCETRRVTGRERYHHGDLRAALVAAGVAAAREGGEAAVGLNRLAAAVGVSASAAYRHFPGGLPDLLVAVGDVGRRELAEGIALRTGAARLSDDPREAARQRFRASGQAYVDYVLAQPGLFQVACRHDEGRAGDADPYALLERCIDDLVATGALPPERRRGCGDGSVGRCPRARPAAHRGAAAPALAGPPPRRRQPHARHGAARAVILPNTRCRQPVPAASPVQGRASVAVSAEGPPVLGRRRDQRGNSPCDGSGRLPLRPVWERRRRGQPVYSQCHGSGRLPPGSAQSGCVHPYVGPCALSHW